MRLPANVPGRTNVIGFLNRDNEAYFHTVDGFVRSRNPEKLTIVVMDNASVHHKAAAKAGWEWLGLRVWLGSSRPIRLN